MLRLRIHGAVPPLPHISAKYVDDSVSYKVKQSCYRPGVAQRVPGI
jgi:hypothetical protein